MSLTFYLESQKYDGRYMYVSCIQTPDIVTNTSRIDWTLVSTGGNATYYATGPTVLKINGQQVFYAEAMGWTARKFPTAKGSVSGSLTIPHNDDGNQSIEVLLSTAIYYVAVEERKATWELNRIDRFATIKSAPDFNDEQNPTITYSNQVGENIGSLQACISLDGSTANVAYRDISKADSSYTFNLTAAERNVLRAATTESNTRTVTFIVRSSIGDNIGHSTLDRTLNIVNADPTLSPVVVDTNSKTVGVTGDNKILVALHSVAQVTLNAAAQKNATIVRKKIEHGNQVLTDDGALTVTNNPITFTVVDSRGNTTTLEAANTIVPYFNPTCSIGNNLPETDGSYDLEVTGLFYNGAIGKTTNTLTIQYRFREGYGDYSEWVTIRTVTQNGNSYAAIESLTGLDYQTSYTFQARVIDAVNSDGITSADKKVIAEPVFHWGKNDFRFNVPIYDRSGARYIPETEVRKLYANNLLDNSNFRNPVNQRQFESGTAVPAWGYFIDRWTNCKDTSKVFTLRNEGVGLSRDCNMVQYLTGFAEGKYLTFAVKLSSGKIYSTSGKVAYSSDGSWKQCFTVGTDFGDLRVVTMTEKLQVNIENVNAAITVEWAALYEGEYTIETLPDYKPKGYGVELVECQRYFQGQSMYLAANQTSTVPIVIPMRIKPSVSIVLMDGTVMPTSYVTDYSVLVVAGNGNAGFLITLSADL